MQKTIDFFVLEGIRKDGAIVYYTGKAGEGFVSVFLSEAFEYKSIDGAYRRAVNLNEMNGLHRINFRVRPAYRTIEVNQ